ncbi:MAG: hydroxyethylthiazole kinase [Roseburia sp.]|nr:hydroxyethylthiazole kinase [Roseburia sp.]
MFGKVLERVRELHPLVHNITNYVTVNDCANMLLACGASPIMADDREEAEEITALCAALHLNIGTLNVRTVPAMLAAGKRAAALGHPVTLDPVGAGASSLRTRTAIQLMREVRPTLIRGNLSEIRTLALGAADTRGVDAAGKDKVTGASLQKFAAFVKAFAAEAGCVAVVTGEIDLVSDGIKTYGIFNGHPMMSKVTGTGCQLSALTAAFLAANKENPVEAAAAAVCAMGICGERAYARLGEAEGNASYRNYIIDAMYRLRGEDIRRYAVIEQVL